MTGQKKLLLFFIVCCVLVLGVVFFSCRVSPFSVQQVERDIARYTQEHVQRKSGNEKHEAFENRTFVTKHLWLSDKNPRLELEMQGAQSRIEFSASGKKTACTETFSNVHGIIQEELFYTDEKGKEYEILSDGSLKAKAGSNSLDPTEGRTTRIPMQRFRYFEADRAVYDYRNNTLIAYGVDFWTYCTSGHELVHEHDSLFPETSGVASSITLCHSGSVGSLQFSAENLKMQLGQKK